MPHQRENNIALKKSWDDHNRVRVVSRRPLRTNSAWERKYISTGGCKNGGRFRPHRRSVGRTDGHHRIRYQEEAIRFVSKVRKFRKFWMNKSTRVGGGSGMVGKSRSLWIAPYQCSRNPEIGASEHRFFSQSMRRI